MPTCIIGLMLTALVGGLSILMSIMVSYTAKKNINFPLLMLVSNLICIGLYLILVPDSKNIFSADILSRKEFILIMAASAVLCSAGMMFTQIGMKSGHNAIVLITSQSAMIIPFLAAVIFWGEPVKATRLAGLFAILTGIVFLGKFKGSSLSGTGSRWFLLALAAMVLQGCGQSAGMVPSFWGNIPSNGERGVIVLLASSAFWGGYAFFTRRFAINKSLIFVVLMFVTVQFGTLFILYKALDVMARINMASIVYPLAIGSCIIGFQIYSVVVIKESFHMSLRLGLALASAGIVLLSL